MFHDKAVVKAKAGWMKYRVYVIVAVVVAVFVYVGYMVDK